PQAPAEQPAAAQAPAEAPPPQAPAEQPAAAQAPAEAPPPQAPAEQPTAAQASAPQPAGGGTVTEAPPRAETLGVSHGTPSGNRLRPEDAVASDAQFEAQEAVYRRRKLIDDLVSSGVPAVSATETERRGSGFLALLYLIIPLIAVVLLLGGDTGSSGEEAPAPEGGGPAPSGDVQVVAENLAFDTDTLELAADQQQTIGFGNRDTEPHNIAIYEDADAGTAQEGALFDGEDIEGGASVTYEVDPIDPGKYYFQCDIHPSMKGDVVAEPGGGGNGGGGNGAGGSGGGGGNNGGNDGGRRE
ncbi:MAG: cupredoxin domain-containing protein, partial [Actinomycetota bacterium]|nr:cupredoxin domain-containing protein [Actinomycetota bacterium]